MASNQVRLRTLPQSDKDVSIELEGDATSKPYGVDMYRVSHGDMDPSFVTLYGDVKRHKRKHPRSIMFPRVIISRANKDALEQIRDSREELTVEPPWADATAGTVCSYLPLQETLSDLVHEDVRSDITFARYSGRFNSTNGRKTAFNKPHYEDAPFGKGLHVSDVINDTHWPSFEARFYATADAADGTNVTTITIEDATYFWAGQIVMVSTEEETTNSLELAEIDSIATNTLTLSTVTNGAASGVLTNTTSYTVAKRTYVTNVAVSDCEMEDSGTGSWANLDTPTLVEKNDTIQETGTYCLRVIGDAANDGVTQTLTPATLPAGTDLVVWARVKVLVGTLGIQFYDTTDGDANQLQETTVSTSWTWLRYAFDCDAGGAKAYALRFYCAAAAAEFLVDRVYIFENTVDNGGMEGTYVDEQTIEVVADIAPGWDVLVPNAGNSLDESADKYGGAKAQDIDVAVTSSGIQTTGDPFESGPFYMVGAYFKVASGAAEITTETNNVIVDGIGDATYTFHSGIWEANLTEKLYIRSDGAAADFLVDDVFAVRLPGNPFDMPHHDLPVPVSTTAFTAFGLLEPSVASTALGNDPYLMRLSRRTVDGNNSYLLTYNQVAGEFRFSTNVAGAGTVSASIADTFSAAEAVYWIIRKSTANGMKFFLKVGTTTTATQTNADANLAGGITRLFINNAGTTRQPQGSCSCYGVINEELSDAECESIIDLFAATDTDRKALLDETHGILWHVENLSFEILDQTNDDKFKGSITLTEAGRVGARSVKDA